MVRSVANLLCVVVLALVSSVQGGGGGFLPRSPQHHMQHHMHHQHVFSELRDMPDGAAVAVDPGELHHMIEDEDEENHIYFDEDGYIVDHDDVDHDEL
mmetsp:Transcript_41405/g.79335  ORF Transcript_41405/g.79335 Transcript_41405/m.79335 type:complete len:98 (+) Transcript_41405:87-380(+)